MDIDMKDTRSIAFTSLDERADILQSIEDGGSVPLGTAMEHARSCKLGPWGDRGMLRRDCVKLMIGEMRAAGLDTPNTVYVTGFGQRCTLAEAIITSHAFNLAFEHARYGRELTDENALRAALGHEPITSLPPQGEPADDDALAQAVATELRIA